MFWRDEGYLLSKTNYNENSIIVEVFTFDHGKYSGVVYGASSREQKKKFQIGNKILINCKSKNQNKPGYFTVELIKPVSPLFFDNKKKSICILAASSILKILLAEGQANKKIYNSFENLIDCLINKQWIKEYILWELSLIKELGYEVNFYNKDRVLSNSIKINDRLFKVPNILIKNNITKYSDADIKDALIFNRNLLIESFIIPNKLRFPLSRNILEKYF